MPQVQFAVALSKTAPYHYMLKMVDGVTTHFTDFPAQTTQIGLAMGDWTPDGVYFLAAGDASSTTPFKLWKRADETFTALGSGGTLSSAETLKELRWLTNTHVVAVGTTAGAWFGVLNRTTNAITWTQFRVDTGYRAVGIDPGGEYFQIVRDTASIFHRYYKRTGDTVAEISMANGNNTSFGITSIDFNDRHITASTRSGTSYIDSRIADWPNLNFLVGAAYLSMPAGNQPSTDAGVVRGQTRWTKNQQHMLYAIGVSPWVGAIIMINDAAPTWMIKSAYTFSPAFTALPNAVKPIRGSEFFVVASTSTAGSGRVRKFSIDPVDFAFLEDTSVSTIFNSWNIVFTDIAVCDPITIASTPAQLYNDALRRMLNGSVDMANLKVALVSSAATFNATHTTLAAAVSTHEVYGSSWPQGGIDIDTAAVGTGTDAAGASLTVSIPSTNLNTAGTLTFRAMIIYDNTDAGDRPLVFVDFGEDKTASQFDRMNFSSVGNRFVLFSPD